MNTVNNLLFSCILNALFLYGNKTFIFPTGKRKIDTFANYSKFGFNKTLRKSMVFVKSKCILDVYKGYYFLQILPCYSETSVPGTRAFMIGT